MKPNGIRKLLVGMLLSSLAMADAFAQAAPGGWYNGLSIKYVYAGRVGGRVAIAVYPPINGGSCSSGGAFGSEMVLDINDPYFVSMYAIVLKAASTGKTINAYTTGACAPQGVQLADVLLNL